MTSQNEDDEPRVLLVRHLPSLFTLADREGLLRFMGARYIRCFDDKGPLKNSAFATFETHAAAKHALQSLHQMNLCGRRLSIEYANSSNRCHFPSEYDPTPIPSSKVNTNEKINKDVTTWSDSVLNLSSRWGLLDPLRQDLCYAYPPPSSPIITNIARALAGSIKFYTQTLHLMNKLHLPAPFGDDVHFPGSIELLWDSQTDQPPHNEVQEMDVSSGEESEIGSDSSPPRIPSLKRRREPRQRNLPPPKTRPADLSGRPVLPTPSGSQTAALEEVFDQTSSAAVKEIRLQLPGHAALSWSKEERQKEDAEEQGGFGVLNKLHSEEEPPELASSPVSTVQPPQTIISEAELAANQLSLAARSQLAVFRNYSAGEQSCRLYVKNLAKAVTSGHLESIFAQFVDWSDVQQRDIFNVRLLTEGRMKGQAFVTLGNEEQATRACLLTNGYQLMERPMVVQFARGAKATADPKSFLIKDSL